MDTTNAVNLRLCIQLYFVQSLPFGHYQCCESKTKFTIYRNTPQEIILGGKIS